MELVDFIRESNGIEGILRDPLPSEVAAHCDFLARPVTVKSLCRFVRRIEPTKGVLRNRPGMNVRVGSYYAPPGGPDIESDLQEILDSHQSPYSRHIAYQTLHPFMDGNGRSGREE